jgi:hypothetical protein
MNDIAVMAAITLFVLAWYGLTLIGREVLRRYETLSIVWCPEVRSFSYIQTETATDRSSVSVKSCLLWPEYSECKSRCVVRRAVRRA